MNLTGVVQIDLSDVLESRQLNTTYREVHLRWAVLEHCPLPMPENVRINIGDAERVVWAHPLAVLLAQVRNVQIVGNWPPAVQLAVADLGAAIQRAVAKGAA